MFIIEQSRAAKVVDTPPQDSDVHVIMQYFEHPHPARNAELKRVLQLLCLNPEVTWIHLLNERIFPEFCGQTTTSTDAPFAKIIQTNLGHRMKFKDVFGYLRENEIKGYHVIINSDICFDETTLANLKRSDLHMSKKMMAQLRYDVIDATVADFPTMCAQAVLFGPRIDSQDTWIFHSDQAIPERFEKLFNFEFGKPGCDNKLLYLMRILGYEVINDPAFVKTYHIHVSQERNYTAKDRVEPPYMLVGPYGYDTSVIAEPYVRSASGRAWDDVGFGDNRVLHDYVADKLSSGTRFVIPRIAGHENNYAAFGQIIKQNGGSIPDGLSEYFNKTLSIMKNNAGIQISSTSSIVQYSDMYLSAFHNCELFAGWESFGHYIRHIEQSHDMVLKWFLPLHGDKSNSSSTKKKMFWAFAFDIFHYIYDNPWTHALRGKRLLIVSPFEESFREKIGIRERLYDGVDLFPECSFLFIKPPQTQGSETSREFSTELQTFLAQLDRLHGQYDVALVSCGGYGNLVCNAIYESGHSAIYVGGVLQMYFGVLGSRWLRERPDVVRLFLNSSWSRPKPSERPKNHGNVEGSCYW